MKKTTICGKEVTDFSTPEIKNTYQLIIIDDENIKNTLICLCNGKLMATMELAEEAPLGYPKNKLITVDEIHIIKNTLTK